MTTTDEITTPNLENAAHGEASIRSARGLAVFMPTGLFARSLIIIIAPVVLLQAVAAFVFMERHWQTVSARLSVAMVADIAAVIDIIQVFPHDPDFSKIVQIARERFDLNVAVMPLEPLPVEFYRHQKSV